MATEAIIFTQIVDANWDQAIYTASPNGTINVAQFAAKGSGTNIGIALTPKGTGYISAQVPDGTTAGGNARGASSVDLQLSRTANAQVASGLSAVALGKSCAASGEASVAMGNAVAASGASALALGQNNTASGTSSVALGKDCSATGSSSVAIGSQSSGTSSGAVSIGVLCVNSGVNSFVSGDRGASYLPDMRAHGAFSLLLDNGASQEIALPLGCKTTTNAEVLLSFYSAQRPILRANTAWCGILHLMGVKSDGTTMAVYHRQIAIKRSGNSTALVKNETVGVDTPAGTSINITADDTNEALSVGVTGVASETWRWVGVFHAAELAIGA